MMRYVHRLDNPKIIKSFGFVGAGGLGAFDSTQYQETEGELPTGYILESSLPSLAEKLNDVFKIYPPEIRAAFYATKAAVKLALEEGDTLAALAIIMQTPVPPELESSKHQMLGMFK